LFIKIKSRFLTKETAFYYFFLLIFGVRKKKESKSATRPNNVANKNASLLPSIVGVVIALAYSDIIPLVPN